MQAVGAEHLLEQCPGFQEKFMREGGLRGGGVYPRGYSRTKPDIYPRQLMVQS